jgi:hypothetical protein
MNGTWRSPICNQESKGGGSRTLTSSMDDRYQALVLVAAYGGLRVGELAGLRPGKVDILHGRVEVAAKSLLK